MLDISYCYPTVNCCQLFQKSNQLTYLNRLLLSIVVDIGCFLFLDGALTRAQSWSQPCGRSASLPNGRSNSIQRFTPYIWWWNTGYLAQFWGSLLIWIYHYKWYTANCLLYPIQIISTPTVNTQQFGQLMYRLNSKLVSDVTRDYISMAYWPTNPFGGHHSGCEKPDSTTYPKIW